MNRHGPVSSLSSVNGRLRRRNEDCGYRNDETGLYAVADGIGGAPGGNVASALAMESFETEGKALNSVSKPWTRDALETMLTRMNNYILDYGNRHRNYRGLGTTFTGLVIESSEKWWLLHAGDSRLYGLGKTEVRQITIDQTLKTERIRMGLSSESKSWHVHENHMLTNYLGSESFYSEIQVIRPRDYCCFLLCTDGLSKSIERDRLQKMIQPDMDDPEIMCTKLIDVARSAGSSDDITVLAIVLQERN